MSLVSHQDPYLNLRYRDGFFEGSPACCQEPRITASLECHAQLRNAIYGLGVRVYGDLRRGIWDEDFWQNHDDLK